MRYLIDSDVLIDYFDGVPSVVSLVDKYIEDGVAVSAIAVMEILEGKLLNQTANEALAEMSDFLTLVRVLDVNVGVTTVCAQLRFVLRKRGTRIRPRSLDLLIAATAIEYGLQLVTRNVADYHDIPGLDYLIP